MDNITFASDKIFSVDKDSFDALAMEIFYFQAAHNPVYAQYLHLLKINPESLKKVDQIPFLPIELFKNHKIVSGGLPAETIFESSGTTGSVSSKHFVADLALYNKSIENGFRHFFGDPSGYVFLALLPSYLERGHSSLAYMMEYLMQLSGHTDNGFYLYNHDELARKIEQAQKGHRKIFFIGVGFALLDFAEKYQPDLSGAIVMETGGMKGRRKELTRDELYDVLKPAFHTEHIMSEYGMAELLSQAYSFKEGHFAAPPWMKIMVRDINDPFSYVENGHTGGVNVIDLANLYSCSFIATQDLGRITPNGLIEISGRFDNSDIRGCSLMYE